jgi:CDP-paratose synthetase
MKRDKGRFYFLYSILDMKILITGSSGYLGSRLANYLSNYHNVTGICRKKSQSKYIYNPLVKIETSDSFIELAKNFQSIQPDIVINTVALYGRKGETLVDLIKANIEFPASLLQLCVMNKVKLLIHTGTSLPDDISNYALTKNTFEKLSQKENVGDTKLVNVSLEHFYGEGDDVSKFTTYIIKSCLNGMDLNLTEGYQLRDFIYIDDVVNAYSIIIDKLEDIKNRETISIGTGTAYPIKRVVELVKNISSSKSNLNFGIVPMRENELMYSCANIERLSELGWVCQNSLSEGLHKSIIGESK